jgi:hypothetical protein
VGGVSKTGRAGCAPVKGLSMEQRIWKLLSNPAIELVATLVVVTVATWYLIDSSPSLPLPLFGRY